jgi:hypothetical protein
MFEYSEKVLTNYDDSNYTHYGANHPKTTGLAFFDKHVQPSGDSCLGSVLNNVRLNLYRLIYMENGMLRVSSVS